MARFLRLSHACIWGCAPRDNSWKEAKKAGQTEGEAEAREWLQPRPQPMSRAPGVGLALQTGSPNWGGAGSLSPQIDAPREGA